MTLSVCSGGACSLGRGAVGDELCDAYSLLQLAPESTQQTHCFLYCISFITFFSSVFFFEPDFLPARDQECGIGASYEQRKATAVALWNEGMPSEYIDALMKG